MTDRLYKGKSTMIGVDSVKEGNSDHTVMAFIVNVSTLKEDNEITKYNHLAEEVMSSLFEYIDFKDNFEIERFVNALGASARSHGSKAMINTRKK